MLITKRSTLTGKMNTMDIEVSKEQMFKWEFGGLLIQKAMPGLTPDEREFLMSGITKEEWDKMFGKEEV